MDSTKTTDTTTDTYEALRAQATSIGWALYVQGLHTPKPRYSLYNGDKKRGGELIVETTDLAVIDDHIADRIAHTTDPRNGQASGDTQPHANQASEPEQSVEDADTEEAGAGKAPDLPSGGEHLEDDVTDAVWVPAKPALELVPNADVIDLLTESFDVTVEEAELPELADIANKWHDGAESVRLEAAWHAGLALIAARDNPEMKHGQFLPWLEQHFHGTRQTANVYMRIAVEGESPANVMTSLHLDDTALPSVNAVTKAIAARNSASKNTQKLSKRDATLKKQKTVRDTAMRKVKAAADHIRTEAVKALGTLTATAANEYASELAGYLSVIDQFYDQVNGMGSTAATEKEKSNA